MTRNRPQHNRRGGISPGFALALASLMALVGLFSLAMWQRPDARRATGSHVELRIYCAAGVAHPVEAALDEYRQAYNVHVELARAGGSGRLFGQIETEIETGVRRGADLFITADDNLLRIGRESGRIAERIPMAVQRPVIAVRADREIKISDLAQLVTASDGLRLGIAHESAAIGRTARQIAQRHGVLGQLIERCKMEVENVMQLAQALESGAIDAAIIWDATVIQINQQRAQPVLKIAAAADSSSEFAGQIAIGVVNNTQHPTEALRVARFLAARDGGLPHLSDAGFQVVDGDIWKEVPEIHLYCGSMFTPVLDETVRAFATREGVNIYPRWEGCGKLVAAMKSISDTKLFPDAYLSCDRPFLDDVRDRFDDPQIISSNEIVLAVRRDSATNVRSPRDLLDPSLRFGLSDPDHSALGRKTRELLSQPPFESMYERLKDRARVTTDTGPTLVSQLLSGGLDAAIVYRSNVVAQPANLKQVEILTIDDQGQGNAKAIQPWAIGRQSRNQHLMSRLFEALTSAESQARFNAAGFHWLYQPQPESRDD